MFQKKTNRTYAIFNYFPKCLKSEHFFPYEYYRHTYHAERQPFDYSLPKSIEEYRRFITYSSFLRPCRYRPTRGNRASCATASGTERLASCNSARCTWKAASPSMNQAFAVPSDTIVVRPKTYLKGGGASNSKILGLVDFEERFDIWHLVNCVFKRGTFFEDCKL